DDGSRPKLLVEYRAESTDEWTPYPGSVVASRERCAIRLDDDELPGDYFQAAASGTAELRITAAIDSDAVLSVHLEGDRNAPDVILQHKRNAHYDEILDSSKHHDPAIVRDDTPRLRQLAIAEAAHTTRPSRATLALATLDPAFRTGDLVPRIGGRGLSLSCRANRAPAVVRAHHDFVNQQTILELQG
ncbi:MAG: hypothetical protein HN909_02705, partial [Phycisphaerales bacterium]|nr:hypothetical protein [Phycisphaerales bacterium]